jgi:hypothetical protein
MAGSTNTPLDEENSSEEGNDAQAYNELENCSSKRKPALRPDRILFHLLPDDWGNDYWIIFLSYGR